MINPTDAVPVWQPLPQTDETPESPETAPPAAEAPVPAAGATRPAAPARRVRARQSNSTTALLVVSALIALGGVGFAVGRATSAGQSSGAVNANQIGFAGPNASGDPGGFGLDRAAGLGATTLNGTVVSVAAGSITLKLADGQTVQVSTTRSTTYHNQAAAAGSDVITGATVTVQTTVGAAAASSAGTNAGASAATTTRTRTATDVTITAK